MTTYNAPLRRSRDNRMIGGVVSGLANYFGLDISLARVIYVVGSICSAAFPGVLVYILLWIVIPEDEYHRDDYRRDNYGRDDHREEHGRTYDNGPQDHRPQSGS